VNDIKKIYVLKSKKQIVKQVNLKITELIIFSIPLVNV
jgi:hypothetical protein